MTLVELQVALVIGALVCAASLAALLHLGRVVDAMVRRETAERRGAEVIMVLESLGRHLRYPVALGDTAMQGELRIGAGVVCEGTPSSVVLAPAVSESLEGLTFLADMPATGDHLEFFAASFDSGEVGWHTQRVVESARVSSQEGCGLGSPFVAAELGTRTVVRLTLPPMLAPAPTGAPVELYRSVRVVAYLAGNTGWVVGLRSCVDRRCGPAQPIVGPVRSAAEGGLRFHGADGEGTVMVMVRVPAIDAPFLGVIPATRFLP